MAIATGVAGLGIGAAKFFEGRKMQKRGEEFIADFEWQDLQNPYENQQVSTLGADMMAEQTNIGTASATEALRAGGTRALVGGLGRIEANRNTINTQAAANLDEQQKAIDRMSAQQLSANQVMEEKRQTDELAGYGQMMNVGLGMKNQGMSDLLNSVGSISQGLMGISKPEPTQNEVQTVTSSIKPVGTTYQNTPSTSLPWMR